MTKKELKTWLISWLTAFNFAVLIPASIIIPSVLSFLAAFFVSVWLFGYWAHVYVRHLKKRAERKRIWE
jgi:hypothetical protein